MIAQVSVPGETRIKIPQTEQKGENQPDLRNLQAVVG